METIWPVRCIGCGKLLATKHLQYKELISQGKTPSEAMTLLGFHLACCRMRIMSPQHLAPGLVVSSRHIERTLAGTDNLMVAPSKSHIMPGVLSAMQSNTPITLQSPKLPPLSSISKPSPTDPYPQPKRVEKIHKFKAI